MHGLPPVLIPGPCPTHRQQVGAIDGQSQQIAGSRSNSSTRQCHGPARRDHFTLFLAQAHLWPRLKSVEHRVSDVTDYLAGPLQLIETHRLLNSEMAHPRSHKSAEVPSATERLADVGGERTDVGSFRASHLEFDTRRHVPEKLGRVVAR